MKKRIFSVIMALTMGIALLAGCGSSDSVSDDTSDTQESSKVLRVGMECNYVPFNWTQESEEVANGDKAVPIYGTDYYAYGYDVMMAKKIADELGMELEIHKVEWDSIGLGLDSKEYDCIIAGMGKTTKREKSYDFTTPYYYRPLCMTVKKGSELEGITKLSEFAGKNVTVTTQLGTAWVDLLDQIPDVQYGANYETTSECFLAVQNGVADVAVIDLPTSQSAVMTNDDLALVILDDDDTIVDPDGSTNVCIAVRKGDTEMLNMIQGAMDALSWSDKEVMDEMMEEAISLQPAAN